VPETNQYFIFGRDWGLKSHTSFWQDASGD